MSVQLAYYGMGSHFNELSTRQECGLHPLRYQSGCLPVVSSGVISVWHSGAAFKLFPLTYCTEMFTVPTVIHTALLIEAQGNDAWGW